MPNNYHQHQKGPAMLPGTLTSVLVVVLPVVSILIVLGCGKTGIRASLHEVSLPSLDRLAPSVQLQITEQYDKIKLDTDEQSLTDEDLGFEYGRMGQLLLVYLFFNDAELAFQNAQLLLPDDTQWPFYLGLLYRDVGDDSLAILHFNRVLHFNENDVPAHVHLAEILLNQGRYKEAGILLQTAVQLVPENARAFFLLGQIASEEGIYDIAIQYYETALRLQPGASRIHFPLSQAYRNLGLMEQSERHLNFRGDTDVNMIDPRDQALATIRQTSGVTFDQGHQLLEEGLFRQAVSVLEQAVSADSTSVFIWQNLGIARAQAGDLNGAFEALNQALELDPSEASVHHNLGVLRAGQRRIGEAEKHFREAAELDPGYDMAWTALADLMRGQGRFEEAIPFYEQVLEITPGNISARLNLALCHVPLKEFSTAFQLVEAGLDAIPQHPGFIDAMARLLAACPLDTIRDGNRALSLARKAVQITRRLETLETLAMAYAETGQFHEASHTIREALQLAEQDNNTMYLPYLEESLYLYEQYLPCRSPWPEFVFRR